MNDVNAFQNMLSSGNYQRRIDWHDPVIPASSRGRDLNPKEPRKQAHWCSDRGHLSIALTSLRVNRLCGLRLGVLSCHNLKVCGS